MGYAHYVLPDGREAGYGVDATCDEPGCGTRIDRGLDFLCGREPGGDEHGCGKYFCAGHLFMGTLETGSLCTRDLDRADFAEATS